MMNNGDEYGRLVYLAGSLFSKTQELNALLRHFEATGQHQGEIHLTHRGANGETTQLLIHIDGTDFTLMPDDSETGFRLDLSGLTVRLE